MPKPTQPPTAGTVNAVIAQAVQAGPTSARAAPEDGALIHVALEEVGPHPDQPRQTVNEDKLRELMAGIVQSGGLLQPINVRPSLPTDARADDERAYSYRLIVGQRRLEAYRRLQASAVTDEERRRYATIPAVVRLGRDRADALKDAILENIQRDDLLPLDAAEALAKLKREAGHKSAKELAAAVGQKEDRVKRLLRLNDAPEVVKAAVRSGVLVAVHTEADGEPPTNARVRREHLRRLDVMEALEFARLHEHYLRKVAASRKPAAAEEHANERTRCLIEKALKEGWGFRRIQEQIEAVVNGDTAADASAAGSAKAPPSPFRATSTELVIRRNRVKSAARSELEALGQLLRDVLVEVEAARATLPDVPMHVPEKPPVPVPQRQAGTQEGRELAEQAATAP